MHDEFYLQQPKEQRYTVIKVLRFQYTYTRMCVQRGDNQKLYDILLLCVFGLHVFKFNRSAETMPAHR